MAAKLETLQLRLQPELLAQIDNYRASQPARPSRAETIRWLLSVGVGVAVEARGEDPAPRRTRRDGAK
jgi:hypothetical protein